MLLILIARLEKPILIYKNTIHLQILEYMTFIIDIVKLILLTM